MKNVICFLFMLTFFACNEKYNAELEISFTSESDDMIQELKEFNLQSIDPLEYKKSQIEKRKIKSFYFKNISTKTPNRFLIESIDTGKYTGNIAINHMGREYNITIDSIHIRPGLNNLSKEINLGTIKLH